MASVTFPPALGGDGSTVTDDANPSTGLANGGHRARFVPSLAQAVAVMSGAVTQVEADAIAAAASEAAAAVSASTAINAPGTNATSTSSVLIGTGNKSLTVQTGKLFVVGQPVMIARTSAPGTTWMAGNVTSYNSGTGALVVNVVWTAGSGTFTDWTVSLAGPANPAAVSALGPSYDKTALMANAPLGQWASYVDVTGYGADWPVPNPIAWWNVFTFGNVARKTQIAQQVFNNSGEVGIIYTRTLHDTAWSVWRPLGQKMVRFVADTGGHMYGETQGGLNTINVITHTGSACDKYMPAHPVPGDECTVIVANGRFDTRLYVDAVVGSQRPIMGLNETCTLDDQYACPTFVYVDPTLGWRLKS